MDAAVDVLNRTTGPPHDGAAYTSSHQLVTGDVPKILTILPVGCRAYAVKPVGSYVKSNFESRAWSGINLGRCSNIPNAYNIWLPEQHKVIQTSEVYFDESLFPWRPIGDQRVEAAAVGNLDNAYHSLGQYERAIEQQEQALAISLAIGDRRGEGQHLGNLGLAYDSLGQYKRAIEHHH